MNGLPGLDEIRSVSRTAVSAVTVIFRGRDRPVAGPPAGQRTAEGGRGRHPGGLRPPRAGARLHRPGRDLRVLPGLADSTRRWSCARCSTGRWRSSCARCRASSRSTGWAARPSSTRWSSTPSAWPAYRLSRRRRAGRAGAEQRRGRRRLHREEPARRSRSARDGQFHGLDDIEQHGRHRRRRRNAGADQEPGARCASGRRCASAPSPSTATARSSPAPS